MATTIASSVLLLPLAWTWMGVMVVSDRGASVDPDGNSTTTTSSGDNGGMRSHMIALLLLLLLLLEGGVL
jgi:endo-1,4-beta-D-glucanase Y